MFSGIFVVRFLNVFMRAQLTYILLGVMPKRGVQGDRPNPSYPRDGPDA